LSCEERLEQVGNNGLILRGIRNCGVFNKKSRVLSETEIKESHHKGGASNKGVSGYRYIPETPEIAQPHTKLS